MNSIRARLRGELRLNPPAPLGRARYPATSPVSPPDSEACVREVPPRSGPRVDLSHAAGGGIRLTRTLR